MRHNFRRRAPFLFILLFVCICTARASHPVTSAEQGKDEMMMMMTGELPQVGPSAGMEAMEEEGAWNSMDVENCGEEDAECLQRRMLSDAHLDYIYTQDHKP